MELLPCPLCGNDEIDFDSVLYEGEPMFVVRCDCCSVSLAPQARDRDGCRGISRPAVSGA